MKYDKRSNPMRVMVCLACALIENASCNNLEIIGCANLMSSVFEYYLLSDRVALACLSQRSPIWLLPQLVSNLSIQTFHRKKKQLWYKIPDTFNDF